MEGGSGGGGSFAWTTHLLGDGRVVEMACATGLKMVIHVGFIYVLGGAGGSRIGGTRGGGGVFLEKARLEGGPKHPTLNPRYRYPQTVAWNYLFVSTPFFMYRQGLMTSIAGVIGPELSGATFLKRKRVPGRRPLSRFSSPHIAPPLDPLLHHHACDIDHPCRVPVLIIVP